MYAYPVIFMTLPILAFLKSEWEFQCYLIFPLSSAKPHSLTPFQAIHRHLSAAGRAFILTGSESSLILIPSH